MSFKEFYDQAQKRANEVMNEKGSKVGKQISDSIHHAGSEIGRSIPKLMENIPITIAHVGKGVDSLKEGSNQVNIFTVGDITINVDSNPFKSKESLINPEIELFEEAEEVNQPTDVVLYNPKPPHYPHNKIVFDEQWLNRQVEILSKDSKLRDPKTDLPQIKGIMRVINENPESAHKLGGMKETKLKGEIKNRLINLGYNFG